MINKGKAVFTRNLTCCMKAGTLALITISSLSISLKIQTHNKFIITGRSINTYQQTHDEFVEEDNLHAASVQRHTGVHTVHVAVIVTFSGPIEHIDLGWEHLATFKCQDLQSNARERWMTTSNWDWYFNMHTLGMQTKGCISTINEKESHKAGSLMQKITNVGNASQEKATTLG